MIPAAPIEIDAVEIGSVKYDVSPSIVAIPRAIKPEASIFVIVISIAIIL